jgi:macrolide transport system ATP-binding/permease protein
MSPERAHREALIRFGNPTATKERVTAADAALMLDSIWSDIRYACRQLAKNPGFACTAILVLAIGIGASVAIFAFVDAALIKPLPYKDPNRLVGLFESNPLGPRFHLSFLDYIDWKSQNKFFRSLDVYDNNSLVMSTDKGVEQTDGAIVSDGFFRTLGVSPFLGRNFQPGEDLGSAPRVVILSYAAWRNRFGARRDALGETVTLNGNPHTIIGVLPADFHFAPAGPAEFWTGVRGSTDPDGRGAHGLSAIARLKDGVTIEAAAADMSAIQRHLATQYPDADGGRGATVVALPEMIVGNLRPILVLLLSGSGLLLLIAAVNVSSLLLLRSENRRRELAVRGALGASRSRLLRQFVTEGLTLVVSATVIGLSMALAFVRLLMLLIPINMLIDMPYLKDLGLNLHVGCFAGAVAIATILLFSVTPAMSLARMNIVSGLAEGSRGSAGTIWKRVGANLVIVELCTAMVLLVGAGLLGKSFYKLLHTDIGFQPDHLAMLRLRAPQNAYGKDEQVVALARSVMSRSRQLPGVRSVAVTHGVPVGSFAAGGSTTFVIVRKPGPQQDNAASNREVSPGYVSTLEARLLKGRYFTDADNASSPRVAIVNRSFAQTYFSNENAIGKQIRLDESEPIMQIVGVLEDIKEGPTDAPTQPALYTPFNQNPDSSFFVVARTESDPQGLLNTLEESVHQIDPEILTSGADTMADRINHSQSMYIHRSSAWLVGGFATLALLLSVIGLYGVIAYSVSQRTREIGVRMALGAERGTVYRLILKEAGQLTGIGIIAGLILSIGAAILMRNLLFGTQAWDIPTLLGVAVILGAAAMLASYFPAHRAASVNPVEALRAE